ncbi:MAG: cysteine--tRNA ligase [Alphaproteobacteria bacterium]
MELKLYNTLTRAKEVFKPLDPNNVRMYVCGPTVYDYAHIGNARPVIVFDVLFRLLRHIYGEKHVTYVRNITDIDDKINARAAERRGNKDILTALRELTEETQRVYVEDVTALGNLPPTYTPRATEHVRQMIDMIARLISAGHAYVAEGHVLFDVSSKVDYGKLSRRSLDEMLAGARVDVAPYKRSPMDFVLWKPSDENVPGWDSPWGRGRPGWHIECSAMAGEYLGETFDIHGGGIDLVFPHHENEIAQSEGAHHGHPLARYWMHNGFLQVEGEKMSKSLGNFVTINELLATDKFGGRKWSGDVLRFNMLRTHYRQPIDWTEAGLDESNTILTRWKNTIRRTDHQNVTVPTLFLSALYDDLNFAKAVQLMHEWGRAANRVFVNTGSAPQPVTDEEAKFAASQLVAAASFVGIDLTSTSAVEGKLSTDVGELIKERNKARKLKDFKEADRIRNELDQMGVQLKDSKDPKTGEIVTTWELKR